MSRQQCERCGGATTGLVMSMFNHQMICFDCKGLEKHHPEYELAEAKDLRDLADRIREQEPGDIGLEKAAAIEATADKLADLVAWKGIRCELLCPVEAGAELDPEYDPEAWEAEPHHKIPRWGCTADVTDLVARLRDGGLPEPIVVWRPVQSGEDLLTWAENAGIVYVLAGNERVETMLTEDIRTKATVMEFVGTKEQAQAVRVTLAHRTRM